MKLLNSLIFATFALAPIASNATVCENHDFFKNQFDALYDAELTSIPAAKLAHDLSALRRAAADSIRHICLPSEAEAFDRLQGELDSLREQLANTKPGGFLKLIEISKPQIALRGSKFAALLHRPNRALELKPLFALLAEGAAGAKDVFVKCETGRDDGKAFDHGYFSTKTSIRCTVSKSETIARGKTCDSYRRHDRSVTVIYTPASEERPNGLLQSVESSDFVGGAECGPGA